MNGQRKTWSLVNVVLAPTTLCLQLQGEKKIRPKEALNEFNTVWQAQIEERGSLAEMMMLMKCMRETKWKKLRLLGTS